MRFLFKFHAHLVSTKVITRGKIIIRSGHVEQQHETKTDRHPETWEGWRQDKQDSRDRAKALTKDSVDKATT